MKELLVSVSPSVPVTSTRHSKRRLVAAAGIAVGGLVLTGGGVLAGLNATAFNTGEAVGSGTLKLVLSDNGAGFTTAVSNLAPGDTVNRYVNLANSGTLDATALTLKVTDTAATNTKLTTDVTNGLNVTVSTCPTAWSATAGTCASTATTVFSLVPVATLKTTASTVAASVAAGGNAFLKVSLLLPDQSETTTNGTLPSNPIQGLSATLVFTFNEVQRAATTTNS